MNPYRHHVQTRLIQFMKFACILVVIYSTFHVSEIFAYDIDIIEKNIISLTDRPDEAQINICVFSDVWSTPTTPTLLIHLKQFNHSLVQQQVELDAHGCYSLAYPHIDGTVQIHVEYPGNPWSMSATLDKEIVLSTQKKPDPSQLPGQENFENAWSFRQRLIMAGKGCAMLVSLAIVYRWRKFFIRILKRIGILRPPMPALPKDLKLNSVHSEQDKRDMATIPSTARQAYTQTTKTLSKEVLRTHIIACFDAVVHVCDTQNGWGRITPARFAQDFGPSLSKQNQCLLETFCQRVEQCAFDPDAEPSENDVIEIHHLAQKLARKLQSSITS